MNFVIVENPPEEEYDWDSLIKDYLDPSVTVTDLCNRNKISKTKYYQIKSRLVEKTGVDCKVTHYKGHLKSFNVTKNIYQNPLTGKYRISKNNKGHMEHFGTYETVEEAIEVRDLLEACDWDRNVFDSDIRPKYHPIFVEEHYGEFEEDYLSGELTIRQLLDKYQMTYYRFKLLSTSIKQKHGLITKPKKVSA